VIKQGIRERAQAAVRNQGAQTRQIKVDGSWQVEELVDGVWIRR
jgi:hypothetical protein